MRYPASEKLEIIRLVERSSLSMRRTLAQLGIPRSTFYNWYNRYREGGPEGLEELLKPFPANQMQAVAVSTYVNNTRNDDPTCIKPAPIQQKLF